MNPRLLVRLAFLASLACASSFGWALPSDRSQPIRISSDTAELDEKQGVSVYRGRVRITQGSMLIRGDKVTVEADDDGIRKMIAVGQPARYEHKPKADQPLVKAQGQVIQFFSDKNQVVILKGAKLEQDDNLFQGDRINYDIKKQLVKAHSKGGTQTGSTGQRVEIVIQPRKEQPEE